MAHNTEISMMGELNFFLGLQVKQLPEGIFICQSKYVHDMKKFSFTDCKPAKTPMSPFMKIHADAEGTNISGKMY